MATMKSERVRHQAESEELLSIISGGQNIRSQFLAAITSEHSVDKQMAAFANGVGGKLLIGVSHKGELKGIASKNVRKFNSIIANAASGYIRPAVPFEVQAVRVSGRIVIVVSVPPGAHKPYMDGGGLIWQQVDGGRHISHTEAELRSLLQSTDFMQADATAIPDTGPTSIEQIEVANLIAHLGGPRPRSVSDAWTQLRQMGLVRAERLTLAGLLLVGKYSQFVRPQFCLRAVCFLRNDISSSRFLDSENFEGRLPNVLSGAFAFLRRNLRKVQTRRSFNSPGRLEIPESVIEEILCNALLHRDYLISAPTRLFLFEDRLEIVSPGWLAGGLTVENISSGSTFIRNPLLTSFATRGLLPYRGLGTGIRRVLRHFPATQFINDTDAMLFRVILPRCRTIRVRKCRRG